MGVHDEIKKYRIKRKLTQSEVAARIPISQSNYSKMEHGLINIDAITLKRLCEILQVSADDLLKIELKRELLTSDYDSIYRAYRLLEKAIIKENEYSS